MPERVSEHETLVQKVLRLQSESGLSDFQLASKIGIQKVTLDAWRSNPEKTQDSTLQKIRAWADNPNQPSVVSGVSKPKKVRRLAADGDSLIAVTLLEMLSQIDQDDRVFAAKVAKVLGVSRLTIPQIKDLAAIRDTSKQH